ncbi:hypothetical protein C8R47DRAFT_1322440 [Mycena vitilis]|nr:hypothetical protein C8R47DRAFT_1322440 [Mycena vitilis]
MQVLYNQLYGLLNACAGLDDKVYHFGEEVRSIVDYIPVLQGRLEKLEKLELSPDHIANIADVLRERRGDDVPALVAANNKLNDNLQSTYAVLQTLDARLHAIETSRTDTTAALSQRISELEAALRPAPPPATSHAETAAPSAPLPSTLARYDPALIEAVAAQLLGKRPHDEGEDVTRSTRPRREGPAVVVPPPFVWAPASAANLSAPPAAHAQSSTPRATFAEPPVPAVQHSAPMPAAAAPFVTTALPTFGAAVSAPPPLAAAAPPAAAVTFTLGAPPTFAHAPTSAPAHFQAGPPRAERDLDREVVIGPVDWRTAADGRALVNKDINMVLTTCLYKGEVLKFRTRKIEALPRHTVCIFESKNIADWVIANWTPKGNCVHMTAVRPNA